MTIPILPLILLFVACAGIGYLLAAAFSQRKEADHAKATVDIQWMNRLQRDIDLLMNHLGVRVVTTESVTKLVDVCLQCNHIPGPIAPPRNTMMICECACHKRGPKPEAEF